MQSGTEEIFLSNFDISELRRLGKTFFQTEPQVSSEPLSVIKETAQLNSYSLPKELNEYLLRPDDFPVLWICNIPLIQQLDDFYKVHEIIPADTYKTQKEFYSKWILKQNSAERKFFAEHFLKAAQKTAKNNFFSQILSASIYAFESSLYDYEKAMELLTGARSTALELNLSDELKTELIYYLLLLQGIIDYKSENFIDALEYFNSAGKEKGWGINAKFYRGLVHAELNEAEIVLYLFKEIYNYDLFRLEHAIEECNYSMYIFFLKITGIKKIFNFNSLAVINKDISLYLGEIVSRNESLHGWLLNKTSHIAELNLPDYALAKALAGLQFLEKVLNQSSTKSNVLYIHSIDGCIKVFNKLVDLLEYEIQNKYNSDIYAKLTSYNAKLQQKAHEIDLLKEEEVTYSVRLAQRLEEGLQQVEESTAAQVRVLEEQMEKIGNEIQNNPSETFKNTMMYNFVVASLIFLMGGCASYSSSRILDVWEFRDIFLIITMGGLKWGLIAFLLGLVVALGAAGLVYMEKTDKKQTLLKRISSVHNEKEVKIRRVKRDHESSEKSLRQNFKKKLTDREEEYTRLKEDREKEEKRLKEAVQDEMNREIDKIESLRK